MLSTSSSLTPITHTTTTSNDEFNRHDQPSIIVPISEAEYIIESLQPFSIHEIGCTPFLRMYGYEVERLSMQAHLSAQLCDGDEYVVDAILTHGKVLTIVKTLLAIEAWRLFVLFGSSGSESTSGASESKVTEGSTNRMEITSKSLAERLAENKSSLRCAFVLHVETTLVSLLNLIMYRRENCAELSSDVTVALVDYCARQMVRKMFQGAGCRVLYSYTDTTFSNL